MAREPSAVARETLALLALHKNVLVSGPPGTGKSLLLSEVANLFGQAPLSAPGSSSKPTHEPLGAIPIPSKAALLDSGLPRSIAEKTKRRVFRTVFHQNSKHRDFVTGLAPSVVRKAGEPDFRIVTGQLFKAAENALDPSGASLLIIDEINRGPAVQVFGGSIVSIEADKRLAPDRRPRLETQYFEIMSPTNGEIVEYALPHDLYILGAMNQADASVEPLDVAFLRRWEMLRLEPDVSVIQAYYGVPADNVALPEVPAAPRDIFLASLAAWIKVNSRIKLGKSGEFQIGHGVLMGINDPGKLSLLEAQTAVAQSWGKVRSHIEEVFFGDLRAVAAVLNASGGPPYHPFKLVDLTFADDPRLDLQGPSRLTAENIYNFLRAVAEG